MARKIVYVCDECEEELDTAGDDFDAARDLLRKKQWRTECNDGEWQHFCDDCRPANRSSFKRWMD